MKDRRVVQTQTREIVPAIDCARFIYNYCLRLCADTWYRQQTRIGYREMCAALAVLKGMAQYGFLNGVSEDLLRRALRDLQRDFNTFHAGGAYPVFRSTAHEAGASRRDFHSGYPTSNRCFDCGYFIEHRPDTEKWTCPDCGVIHQTVENSTRNAQAVERALAINQELPNAIQREPP